jgi:transposase-like protein
MATRKKYTKEFKQDAVRLVTEQGYKQTEAARNLGIDRGMLGRWIKEFQTDEGEALHATDTITDLEPCINGAVSETGTFPSQAEEDAHALNMLEPAINGEVSASGRFSSQEEEDAARLN